MRVCIERFAKRLDPSTFFGYIRVKNTRFDWKLQFNRPLTPENNDISIIDFRTDLILTLKWCDTKIDLVPRECGFFLMMIFPLVEKIPLSYDNNMNQEKMINSILQHEGIMSKSMNIDTDDFVSPMEMDCKIYKISEDLCKVLDIEKFQNCISK